jgi:hypothetical protein
MWLNVIWISRERYPPKLRVLNLAVDAVVGGKDWVADGH